MFLLFLLALVVLGVYTGWNSAEKETPQWPKLLWALAGMLVLVGVAVAMATFLHGQEWAGLLFAIVMFLPWLVLGAGVGAVSLVVELVVRHHRRRAGRAVDSE
ncbi:hypothetical protein ACQ86G_17290 [Roseateles chitinivorans]|uniref:hypothetical protein n=1 Tax=Roseateles chitinivorans TaxID=2917965 RepID=UPI003D66B42B